MASAGDRWHQIRNGAFCFHQLASCLALCLGQLTYIAYLEAFEIGERSQLDDKAAMQATKIGSYRLLAVKRAGGTIRWNPDAGFVLSRGDTLLVLATRKGLNDILDHCRPGGADR